jgi:small subunit ribosomal protein S24e
MIHPDMGNVPKASIKAKLSTMFKVKEEAIGVYGLKTKFGGGRTTGFALVYDNVDSRKKCDSKKMLRRVSDSSNLFFY